MSKQFANNNNNNNVCLVNKGNMYQLSKKKNDKIQCSFIGIFEFSIVNGLYKIKIDEENIKLTGYWIFC